MNGKLFHGAKDYSLTFPAVVPTRSHWSITVYNSAKQLHCQKDRIHSANSFRINQVRPDRTITIMFSASCEGKPYCTETPKDGWYAISRIYEPEQSVIDGTWMFPQIKELER
jgi:hypothetical protein